MTTSVRLPNPEGKVFRKDIYFERTGYVPHNGQAILHADPTRHKAVSNGRRWGKTLYGGKEAEVETYVKNFLGEPKMGWIIGPNYSDCEKEFRVVYNSLKKLGVDKVSDKFLNNVESGSMRIHTRWGFDLQCRSAAHPDSLVGEGLDFVLLVEAGKHHRRTFTEYVRPALSDKRGWSLMTGVPELASDTSLLFWAWERGQDRSKLQWNSYQMPSWTNNIVFPGGRNDPEILEAEDDLTTDEFDRQYGGKFVERIGRVMSHWDDSVNTAEFEYNPLWPLYAAIDYGYTNDWVWLWIQIDPFNNVYVLGEERWRMRDTEEICDEINLRSQTSDDFWKLLGKVNVIYCPPAEPSETSVVRRKLNRPTATNTGGEINDRNKMTNALLKQRPGHLPDGHPDKKAQLVLNKSTTHQLQWEMKTGYRWPEHKSDIKNAPENPMDKDDHGPEALGRFVVGHMGGKMPDRRHARQSRVRSRRN